MTITKMLSVDEALALVRSAHQEVRVAKDVHNRAEHEARAARKVADHRFSELDAARERLRQMRKQLEQAIDAEITFP